MMKFIAALGVAMLIASQGYAADAPKCGKNLQILNMLNEAHAQVPDLKVAVMNDKADVASATKIINDAPPPTHFKGDQVYLIMSQSMGYGYAILTDHQCIQGNLKLSLEGMAKFLAAVKKGEGVDL